MTSSVLQSLPTGALTSSPAASSTRNAPSPPVRLDSTNFMLWRGLTLPNLSGAGLHSYLTGAEKPPAQMIKQGTGDAVIDVANPAYLRW